jgi:hypothetical protein
VKLRLGTLPNYAITYKDCNAYSMLYLYDPFREEITRQVVANIHSSVSGVEHEMLVIYSNPVCHELLVKDGVFCKQREYPDGWENGLFILFELRSAAIQVASFSFIVFFI